MKFASTIIAFAALVAVTAACSCTMPKTCIAEYKSDSTPMMKATVEMQIEENDPAYNWYIMKHNAQFRGCKPNGEYFVLKTPATPAECGLTFKKGTCYLVTAKVAGGSTPPPSVQAHITHNNLDVYVATSCDFNKMWEEIPYKQQNKLWDLPVTHCEEIMA